jgi:hypothetical protein
MWFFRSALSDCSPSADMNLDVIGCDLLGDIIEQ